MRKIGGILFLLLCASLLIGCGGPAANNTVNTNAAAAKPAAAAPTADALLAMDKQANEAYFKGDSAFWTGFLSDKAVFFNDGKANGKDALMKMLGGSKCDMKSYSLDEPKMAMIDNDDYVLVYKTTVDAECNDGPGGKMQKEPSPIRAATLYTRNGDKWQAVWHSETPIVTAGEPAKAADDKAADKKADDTKTEAKKEEPKKEEPKKDDKPAPASNSNSGANTAAAPAAAPAKSANTDALVKLHQAGWEAFKAKDAKWFDANIANNFMNVNPDGSVAATKADAIKLWTTEDCKDITKVSATDGYSVALSPTLELFNLKGNADGTCMGHKNGDLWQTTLYIKDGDAWKLAFMFENPPRPGM